MQIINSAIEKYADHMSTPVDAILYELEKETYQSTRVHSIVNNYFNGSFKKMLSFFVQKEDLDINDLEEIKQLTKNKEE